MTPSRLKMSHFEGDTVGKPVGMARHQSTEYRGEPTRLLTINDVAGLLVVHRDSVYSLVRRGDLHPIRVGTRLRFRLEDIEAYLAQD